MFQYLGLVRPSPRPVPPLCGKPFGDNLDPGGADTALQLEDIRAVFPPAYQTLFGELLLENWQGVPPLYRHHAGRALRRGKGLEAVRWPRKSFASFPSAN